MPGAGAEKTLKGIRKALRGCRAARKKEDALPVVLQARLFFLKERCRELGMELTNPAPKVRMNIGKSRLDDDEKKWTSVGPNKQPVKIGKGQTKAEAVQGFIAEKEAEREAEKPKTATTGNSKSLSQFGALLGGGEMERPENGSEATTAAPSTAADVIREYGPKVRGMKSKCGVVVGEISNHAAERISERSVSLSALQKLIADAPIVYSGNKPGTTCQQRGNLRLVLANDGGAIVSVVERIH